MHPVEERRFERRVVEERRFSELKMPGLQPLRRTAGILIICDSAPEL